jgi:hypothetical protein
VILEEENAKKSLGIMFKTKPVSYLTNSPPVKLPNGMTTHRVSSALSWCPMMVQVRFSTNPVKGAEKIFLSKGMIEHARFK